LIAIAGLIFNTPIQNDLQNLSSLYWFIAGILLVLFFVIPAGRLGDILNALFGALLVIFAYGFSPEVQSAFKDGRVALFSLFLFVVAVYMNKATQIEF
jgi:hypothetical protein